MTATGKVYIFDDKKSAYGATVTNTETNKQVNVDLEGNFSIPVTSVNTILNIEFAGITIPKQVKVSDLKDIIYIRINPEKEVTVQVRKKTDYTMAYVGITLGTLMVLAYLITRRPTMPKPTTPKKVKL